MGTKKKRGRVAHAYGNHDECIEVERFLGTGKRNRKSFQTSVTRLKKQHPWGIFPDSFYLNKSVFIWGPFLFLANKDKKNKHLKKTLAVRMTSCECIETGE